MLDTQYQLGDRYVRGLTAATGPVYMTGTQALVRMLLAQAAADRAAGLETAGFVSGYRGSPLGGVDQELWKAAKMLEAGRIRFQPAINEDLAATTLIGTQRVEADPERIAQGVFGLWYGKGPGVDRSGDALKHGNAFGSSPHGGVLVVAGDDHGCVSSSMSHQSDPALMAWGMPVIHPADIADYEAFGLWGWAASRVSGAWVGFKAISEVVEGAASVAAIARPSFVMPEIDPGPDGLHIRWPDLPGPQFERRIAYKLKAAAAFARANPLDAVLVPVARPRLLIATVGKAHGDLMEALAVGGLSPERLAESGIAIVKLGLVHPLSPLLADLAATAGAVWVVEEKAPVVETLLKQHLFNAPADRRPLVLGKTDATGTTILPADIELRPSRVAAALRDRLAPLGLALSVPAAWLRQEDAPPANLPVRSPYFCSGCPHNTSTKVPEGSRAQPGIGCHFMASWMDRDTEGAIQMGGEGADWIGQSAFTKTPHIFQNMGDGTFFHSGHLAIRQAVAARVNITFKVLFNDAVAMTGGQPVDGPLTAPQITRMAAAEGASRIVVVADDPAKYPADAGFAPGVTVHHRDELDAVQRTLRDVPGVTVLVYDQVCATEVRRRRKRGKAAPAQRRVVINDLVCEGCGDCQRASNCLSVVPIATEFGRKRAIDQGSCNSDLSCVKGFCPSFVTIEGGEMQRAAGADVAAETVLARAAALPMPDLPPLDRPWEILVTGVGGTGVVTVGALITMAAHLSGQGASVLDFMGFAQKGGQVLSHVRLARTPDALLQVRIDRGRADAIIAADLVVAASREALATIDPGRTRIVANTREQQIGTMLRDPTLKIDTDALAGLLARRAGAGRVWSVDAQRLAERLTGDAIQANILLLGAAWQSGLVPVSLAALERAIELNGVAVAANRLALAWGRLAVADADFVGHYAADPEAVAPSVDLDEVIRRRVAFLTDYQDARYAARYADRVAAIRAAESRLGAGLPLTEAVARNLFKLMAVKDEYEVARLHTRTGFLERTHQQFGSTARLRFHLAPPLLSRRGPDGLPAKREFGPWIVPVFRQLAKLRGLRGTRFDVFGLTAERRMERALLSEYEDLLDMVPGVLAASDATSAERATLLDLARLPEGIRGFGHVKAAGVASARMRRDVLLAALARPAAKRQPDRMTALTAA